MYKPQSLWLALFFGTGVLCLTGCSGGKSEGEEIQTHPVTGTVTNADGTPLKLGTIEFRPLKDAKANGNGVVENGEFKITMMLDKQKYEGVPEGEYTVSITIMAGDQVQQGNPETITLPDPITIKAGEQAPLKLKLPKKSR